MHVGNQDIGAVGDEVEPLPKLELIVIVSASVWIHTLGGFRIRRLDMVAPSTPSKAKSMGRSSYKLKSVASTTRDANGSYSLVSQQLLPVNFTPTINDRLVVAQVAIDVDILSAKFPEDGLVLKRELEAVVGPVVHIILEVNFSGDDDVNVLQEGEVQRRGNKVVIFHHHSSAMVALLERLENGSGIILVAPTCGLHIAVSALVSRRRIWQGLPGIVRRRYQVWPFRDVVSCCYHGRHQITGGKEIEERLTKHDGGISPRTGREITVSWRYKASQTGCSQHGIPFL